MICLYLPALVASTVGVGCVVYEVFVVVIVVAFIVVCVSIPSTKQTHCHYIIPQEVLQGIPSPTGHFCPHCATSSILAVIVSGISPCTELRIDRVLLTVV